MTPLQMLFIPLCLACQEGTSNFFTCKCSIQCHVQMDIHVHVHVHVFFPVACDLCILASNHKIVGISTLSRKEHATAQTRELECTKIVLPQVVERGTCTCIYIIIYMYMGVLCCFALFVCLTLCASFFHLICIFVYMYVYMWYTFTCVYMYCSCVCAIL